MSLTFKGTELRAVFVVMAVLAVGPLCQGIGRAEGQWPAYKSAWAKEFTVYVDSKTTTGGDLDFTFTVYLPTTWEPGDWRQFGEFVVYTSSMPVGFETMPPMIGTPPKPNPNNHWRYDYARKTNGGAWWENDVGWYGVEAPEDQTAHYDGGFLTYADYGENSGAFGWMAHSSGSSDFGGGGWARVPDTAPSNYAVDFRARLPAEAAGWIGPNAVFSMSVRTGEGASAYPVQGNRVLSRRDYSRVPEPGTFALLATGAVGLLPLLRRRRKA
jgi:hypothetical protein